VVDGVVDSSLRGMTVGKLEVVIDLHHVDGLQVGHVEGHGIAVGQELHPFDLQPLNGYLGRAVCMRPPQVPGPELVISQVRGFGLAQFFMKSNLDAVFFYAQGFWQIDGLARVHVVDLAEAHVRALEKLIEDPRSFVCNLGTGCGSTVLEVVGTFEKVTGEKVPRQIVSRRPGDVAKAWADPAFANRLLGWEAKHSLAEMLVDAWRWQRHNPQGYRGDVESA